MTRDNNFARQLTLVSRWRVLAEKRLEFLNELFETGRWRRYHTEQAFIDNIRDAKRAVEAWRKLEPFSGNRIADVAALLRYADQSPMADTADRRPRA